MAERTMQLGDLKEQGAKAVEKIRQEVVTLVDEIDLSSMSKKIEQFGREKPVALALAALTVGVAAGVLMKKGWSTAPIEKT